MAADGLPEFLPPSYMDPLRRPLRNHRDLLKADRGKAVRFGHELIRRGVYCTPGGKLYLSLAHTDAHIARTLEIAAGALQALR